MSDTRNTPTRRTILGGGTALAAAAAAAAKPALAQSEASAPDLSGKSILITGASSGFGRLSALYFARQGANVFASMRNMQGGDRPEAKELVEIGYDEKLLLAVLEIDVTDDEQVAKGVAKAEEMAHGKLDVVLNNAGIGIGGPIELQDIEASKLIFDTNTLGYHRVARAALPKMRAHGEGLLLSVSSQLGRFLYPNIGNYSPTKFAVEAMFEALAYEVAPFGVEVCIIQPGGYPTKIWDNGRRHMDALFARQSEERLKAYETHLKITQNTFSGVSQTDPMDVPRAIAEVIAMPVGKRPLRRPVAPDITTVSAANAAMAEIQASLMSSGVYKDWHDAVTD